eukprot:1611857-Rhodomonas_salina.4
MESCYVVSSTDLVTIHAGHSQVPGVRPVRCGARATLGAMALQNQSARKVWCACRGYVTFGTDMEYGVLSSALQASYARSDISLPWR